MFKKPDAVADFTVGMMLNLDRSVVERELHKNHGQWRRDVSKTPGYHAMSLAKVGIIGFSEVGRKVAERLLPFESSIYVFDPDVEDADIQSAGCHSASLESIFSNCDIITLHSDKGNCIADKAHIDLMKNTSWLINVTDPCLVDEDALLNALESKKICGAGLDVFNSEPILPDSKFIGLPNVILTPHIADDVLE